MFLDDSGGRKQEKYVVWLHIIKNVALYIYFALKNLSDLTNRNRQSNINGLEYIKNVYKTNRYFIIIWQSSKFALQVWFITNLHNIYVEFSLC